MVAALLAVWCLAARAAEEPAGQPAQKPALSATVVNKDGTKVELRAFEIVGGSAGLFGSSSTKLEALPVKTSALRLDVPMDKLTKIEVVSSDKMSKEIKLKLTSNDGKTLDVTLDSDQKVKWKGMHPFADSEATLDLSAVKEIVLTPEKK